MSKLAQLRRASLCTMRPLFGHAGAATSGAWLLAHLVLWGLAAAGASMVDGPPAVRFAVHTLAIGFIGTRMRALGNMMHEAVHNQLAERPATNMVFGHLLAIVLWSDFTRYREVHVSHHRYLGDPERDLDLATRLKSGLSRSDRALWWHLAQGLTLRAASSLPRPVLRSPEAPRWARRARALFVAAVVAGAVWRWQAVALWVILPYFSAYMMLCYVSDALDHARLAFQSEEFERTRNHLLPHRALDALLQPRNDAYHLVHHIFPRVPTAKLPEAHRRLLRHSAYSALEHRLTWGVLTVVPPQLSQRSPERVASKTSSPSASCAGASPSPNRNP